MLNEFNEVNELTAVLLKASILLLHLPVEDEEDLCLDRWHSEDLAAEGRCCHLFVTKSSQFIDVNVECCPAPSIGNCFSSFYMVTLHNPLETWFTHQSAWGLRSVQDSIWNKKNKPYIWGLACTGSSSKQSQQKEACDATLSMWMTLYAHCSFYFYCVYSMLGVR